VPMLAELIDAVVGVDTHRDTHQVEIALPNGVPIAATTISNDSSGYAELLAWIVDHAPGPRLAVSIEGTRSYGIGLARAAAAAGLMVLECEQPHRTVRHGRGKSDPIDAHLAVLTALRVDADRLPTPRADGDREALRILLGARQEMTSANTAQTNRLRALLLGGDDTDRTLARSALTETRLSGLARRRPPREASREQAVRHAEIRRLALALLAAARTQGQPHPAADHRQRPRPRVDRASRHRPGQRRAGYRLVLPPWPVPQRSRIRRPRRRLPAASQQRSHRAAPAQPRPGPRPEPGSAHHRRDPDAQLPDHPGLHRPTHRRGQEPTRDPPLPQAVHRTPALPHADHHNGPGSQAQLTAHPRM